MAKVDARKAEVEKNERVEHTMGNAEDGGIRETLSMDAPHVVTIGAHKARLMRGKTAIHFGIEFKRGVWVELPQECCTKLHLASLAHHGFELQRSTK